MNYGIANKRKYNETQEEVIDMPYILNADRALTSYELKRMFPKASYSQYFDAFLKRRIEDILKRYSDSQWFKDRYENERNICNIGVISKFIHIKNILSSVPDIETTNKIKEIVGESKIFMSQNNIEKHFSKEYYVVIENDSEIEMICDNLKKNYDAKIIQTTDLEIKDYSSDSEEKRKILFSELIKYEKPLFEIPADNSDFSAEMFKKTFNFCLTCCRKFDNCLAMLMNCSAHTEADYSPRRIDILIQQKNINNMIEHNKELIQSHYKKTVERNFKCNECSKTFDSTEHITNHLKNKHDDLLNSVILESQRLENFLGKIDFFSFELALGTYEKSVPPYGVSAIKEDVVIYDIPCIFSGNLSFNK